MIYKDVVNYTETYLLSRISELYQLEGYEMKQIAPHEGGRNVVYTCEKEGSSAKIIRIAYLNDRNKEDILGEVEYVHYLYEGSGSVSNVISSRNGQLVEEIIHENHTFLICLFEKARGKKFVENNYQYREGVPLTEYYYNCGKVLGKLHQLSKSYTPNHQRYSFFDKFNAEYINKCIPDSLGLLKNKLIELINTTNELHKDSDSFGMVHFDYNDGNYMIDFDSGQITVYDFDNTCYCWYMFDLASAWTNGMGWIQFESDVNKRKKFMEDYFKIVLEGYRSETSIDESMLEKLPFFIRVNLMEGILDRVGDMQNSDEELVCDEDLSYLIKCMEDDIPYMGFFHEMYNCEEPFTYEERKI